MKPSQFSNNMNKTFLKFKKGKQRALVLAAIIKAGSESKLSKLLQIHKARINDFKFEKRNLSSIYTHRLLLFLGLKKEDIQSDILVELSPNWGKIKGGKSVVKLKKEKGTFHDEMQMLKKLSSLRMKKWHEEMKRKNPKQYHIWQYERFKKIGGGYKVKTANGLFVRNGLERELANFLSSLNLQFQYEPYLKINNKVYFPDFMINNCVIEATEWRHPSQDKITALKTKIHNYQDAGYSACVFVPPKYRNFYKEVENWLISTHAQLTDFLSLHSSDA